MKSLQQSMMQKIGESAGIARSPHLGDGTGLYANFVGHHASAKDLFGDNLPRLQELKMKYDPTTVFRKWHDLFGRKNNSAPENHRLSIDEVKNLKGNLLSFQPSEFPSLFNHLASRGRIALVPDRAK